MPVFCLALLADTTEDYSLDEDMYKLMDKIKAKPFNADFNEQLEAAQKLYGDHLELSFTNKDIDDVFDMVKEYYDSEIINRAKTVLLYQKHKYQYIFN